MTKQSEIADDDKALRFLDVDDLSVEELGALLKLARKVKAEPRELAETLNGVKVAVIFEKNSTRTRVSLEVAITEMGGHAIILDTSQMQLGRGESIADTARVLSRYVDCIVARVGSHSTLEEMYRYSSVPVLNALSDRAHPMQTLADLQTMEEYAVQSVAYCGDGNNVASSLLLGSAMVGLDVRVASPPGFEPPVDIVQKAHVIAGRTGGRVLITNDLTEAVNGVDALYTDVWVSMGDEVSAESRRVALEPYRITSQVLGMASPSAVVLHCLPAHRGQEIDADVIDGDRSAVFDQAENRLHAQKALLAKMLGSAS